jgi:perosamine synthetase
MDAINALAQKHNLFVVEDAAESHGAEYKGVRTRNLAHITTFSFFANKNITTGEGGMVLTNDERLYKKALYYKNLCFPIEGPRNYIHDEIGYNYRMTNIHAAIGLAQTERADAYKEMRIANAMLYRKYLKGTPGITFQQTDVDVLHVHWMNTIVINPNEYGKTRDKLMTYLKSKNIDTRLLFVGMHKQPALKNYGCETNETFPVTDWLTENGLYLPSASNLKEETIQLICNEIVNFRSV